MRQILFTIGLLMAAQLLVAQTTINGIIVTRADGTATEYAFEQQPVFKYSGQYIIVSLNEVETLSIPTSEKVVVTYARVESDPGTTTAVESTKSSAKVIVRANTIEIQTAANHVISLYNIQGSSLLSTTTDASGSATINTTNLPKGIYILKGENINFKYLK